MKAHVKKLEKIYVQETWRKDEPSLIEAALTIGQIMKMGQLPGHDTHKLAWACGYTQNMMMVPAFHRRLCMAFVDIFQQNSYLKEAIKEIRHGLADEKNNEKLIELRNECDFSILNTIF